MNERVSVVLKIDSRNANVEQEFKSGNDFLLFLIALDSSVESNDRPALEISMPGFLLGSTKLLEKAVFEMKDSSMSGGEKVWELKITTSSSLTLLQILDALHRRLTSQPYMYRLEGASEDDTEIELAWQSYISSTPDQSLDYLHKFCLTRFLTYKSPPIN
ncbi:hypothetical protein DSO57_1020767 [Entomophthora muscae]|uniref:Uncharacterized protein n=1 Tax=Entomophthora muscae TaxID=34485 RepID=A0ACC2RUM0_9FUNG|nr:hypothetical protein DSO57_1020767 [Entomophthora muscae]